MNKESAMTLIAVCLMTVVFAIISSVYSASCVQRLYPMAAVVSGFDRYSDSVLFIGPSGSTWWVDDSTGWQLGDQAAFIMDSRDTKYIYDDLIVSIRPAK